MRPQALPGHCWAEAGHHYRLQLVIMTMPPEHKSQQNEQRSQRQQEHLVCQLLVWLLQLLLTSAMTEVSLLLWQQELQLLLL